jgi:DNA helicase HerA-like ATPase
MTPQFGVLGRSGTQSVAIDLTGCNTISLFGVQGFGKSYTLGVIAEMASLQNEGVNVLPSPLATVLFHFHKSDAYEPEYVTAVKPNRKTSEVDRLLADYGAKPAGLRDVLLLAPEAKVEARRQEYPGLAVEPIKFSSAELGAESWKFLLGAYGNDALYVRQLVAIMRRHRQGLTLDTFRQEITNAQLPTAAQRLAEDRLALAEPYIDDTRRLGELLRPGRTVIVDLRDEWIEKDEALGLFVVMLRIFAASRFEGNEFNKLVVFDEAHKYISESDLISQVVETIREMRHQATSVIIASQDPLSVPRAIIELTSVLILHRMTSPQWLKHLRGAIVSLNDVQDAAVTSLSPGEALVWAQRSTDKRFTLRPQKVSIRPRFTQHGGGTKTAVDGVTIR